MAEEAKKTEKKEKEGQNTEQLAKDFREYSVAEFFKKNRQMLGYSGKVRSLTTIVHEYVTNSLDSCEDAKILPELKVEIKEVDAKTNSEPIGTGDGVNLKYSLPLEVVEADSYIIKMNGIEQTARKDYDVKMEKKGRDSFKNIVFRQPPSKDSKIDAIYSYGHLIVVVEDNGTGIPRANIGQAIGKLLAGTKFHQRRQKRGQQGIGASYCTLFAQITTGKPTKVKSGTGNGKIFECEVSIDVKSNEPVLANEKEYSRNYRGTKIEAEFSEVSYNRSEHGVYEYLRRTALANPHTQITLVEPNKEMIVFPRASNQLPNPAENVLPHPLGVTTADLMEMAASSPARKMSSFLQSDFTRISSDKVKELDALVNAGLDPKKDKDKYLNFDYAPRTLTWDQAERTVRAIQKVKWIAPDMSALIPIGEEQILKSLKNLLQPEQMKVIERKPKVFKGGIPFLVEAAIAYGGKAGTETASEKSENATGEKRGGEVLRFANRVPLLFDAGNCAITEAVKSIDWGRYDLKNWEELPVTLFVNFVSVYVPYTGAGKLAISAEEEIVVEIRNALMESAREVSMYLHSLQKIEDQEQRRMLFFRYVGEVAEALEDVTGKDRKTLEAKLRKIAEVRTSLEEKQDEAEMKELEEIEEKAEKEIEEE